MQSNVAVGSFRRVNPAMSRPWVDVQLAVLAAGGGLALLGLGAWLFPQSAPWWLQLPTEAGAAGLACAMGLGFCFAHRRGGEQRFRQLMAVTAALIALVAIAGPVKALHGSAGMLQPGIPPTVALAFLFLALNLFFLRSDRGVASFLGDVSVFGLGWSVLTLIFDGLFSAMHIFGVSLPAKTSPATVWILGLLSVAAIARRTEYGAFSLLRGGGISGRLIRILFWIVLILPFLREALRARLIATGMVPEHSAAASLAASAVVFGMGFLLLIGYYFQRMENEVRELSLRDELTGVYNLRGFRLLAAQAFRLAQRSHQPFSVLFVDVDDLKQINDELGHAVGSTLLVETADLLRSSFRETDVVGRIGGDEFAVAGHFDGVGIEQAAERLAEENAGKRDPQRPHASLSMGHVTANPEQGQSLEDLLALADAAMYEQKRSKKQQVTV